MDDSTRLLIDTLREQCVSQDLTIASMRETITMRDNTVRYLRSERARLMRERDETVDALITMGESVETREHELRTAGETVARIFGFATGEPLDEYRRRIVG